MKKNQLIALLLALTMLLTLCACAPAGNAPKGSVTGRWNFRVMRH